MADEKERLQNAQWVFERQLAWIAAAEVKIGVIVALDTGMLGALGAAFSAEKVHSAWAIVWLIGASFCLGSALICCAIALLPRVNGPVSSLLFFGTISKIASDDYIRKFKNATTNELLDDWCCQIHRNSEIAVAKFLYVRKSILFSFLSIGPWFIAIITLLKIAS
ncbi:hypothetical protein FHI69_02835 [Janthinobacterium lividum]|uniref:Pycsar effector protein domain-containing protein n=1 Tax=Janthinobacterium lividum TaxID=29581 RepID=A0A5C4P025_9BURK|nr:Pycsar system effector family protein [Janthinobacterium lividum]TNC78247.1 hypothetical protein FHI69_02835 [Janthinobacterium lividum]